MQAYALLAAADEPRLPAGKGELDVPNAPTRRRSSTAWAIAGELSTEPEGLGPKGPRRRTAMWRHGSVSDKLCRDNLVDVAG
jgi:hypothetical protein